MGKENKKKNDLDFPGSEELDKAISEHQELSEEVPNLQNNKEIINETKENYIQDIAKDKFGIEKDFEERPRRKGKHF